MYDRFAAPGEEFTRVADPESSLTLSFRNPSISADGLRVAFVRKDGNDHQIYVFDAIDDTTSLVSQNNAGQAANSFTRSPSISPDGLGVTFASEATNLVPGLSGPRIYVRSLASDTTTTPCAFFGGCMQSALSDSRVVLSGGFPDGIDHMQIRTYDRFTSEY